MVKNIKYIPIALLFLFLPLSEARSEGQKLEPIFFAECSGRYFYTFKTKNEIIDNSYFFYFKDIDACKGFSHAERRAQAFLLADFLENNYSGSYDDLISSLNSGFRLDKNILNAVSGDSCKDFTWSMACQSNIALIICNSPNKSWIEEGKCVYGKTPFAIYVNKDFDNKRQVFVRRGFLKN